MVKILRSCSHLLRGLLLQCCLLVGGQMMGVAPLLAQDESESLTVSHELPHPLQPLLELAQQGATKIEKDIHDYRCVLIRRERVNGRLTPYQHIQAKIRHAQQQGPQAISFATYLKFLAPADVAGREVLFVENERYGDLIARRGGKRLPNMTLILEPTGPLAMEGNRYPVTEIGIKNLLARLIEVAEAESSYGECDVKMYRDAKLDGRPCLHVEITHPVEREHFKYHMARIYIDQELQIPLYFASYSWPKQDGEKPSLLEEYAYTKLQFNVGFKPEEFKPDFKDYRFDLSVLKQD